MLVRMEVRSEMNDMRIYKEGLLLINLNLRALRELGGVVSVCITNQCIP